MSPNPLCMSTNQDDMLFGSNKPSSIKEIEMSVDLCDSVNLLAESIELSNNYNDEVLLESDNDDNVL